MKAPSRAVHANREVEEAALAKIPARERDTAYQWELEYELELRERHWYELGELERQELTIILTTRHTPAVVESTGVGEDDLRMLTEHFAPRPRRFPRPPADFQTPHLLYIRWRDFSKTEVEQALSEWAKKTWESENHKKTKRSPGKNKLLQLAAYRMRNAGRPVEEVVNALSAIAGTGSVYDASWVRRAVRQVRKDISETRYLFESQQQ